MISDNVNTYLSFASADSPHMKHVRNVFRIAGYQRFDENKIDNWDVLWSHDYPFGSKFQLKELKENQLVMIKF